MINWRLLSGGNVETWESSSKAIDETWAESGFLLPSNAPDNASPEAEAAPGVPWRQITIRQTGLGGAGAPELLNILATVWPYLAGALTADLGRRKRKA